MELLFSILSSTSIFLSDVSFISCAFLKYCWSQYTSLASIWMVMWHIARSHVSCVCLCCKCTWFCLKDCPTLLCTYCILKGSKTLNWCCLDFDWVALRNIWYWIDIFSCIVGDQVRRVIVTIFGIPVVMEVVTLNTRDVAWIIQGSNGCIIAKQVKALLVSMGYH